jgi:hypothetical protein
VRQEEVRSGLEYGNFLVLQRLLRYLQRASIQKIDQSGSTGMASKLWDTPCTFVFYYIQFPSVVV